MNQGVKIKFFLHFFTQKQEYFLLNDDINGPCVYINIHGNEREKVVDDIINRSSEKKKLLHTGSCLKYLMKLRQSCPSHSCKLWDTRREERTDEMKVRVKVKGKEEESESSH